MRIPQRSTRLLALWIAALLGLAGPAAAVDTGPYEIKIEQVDAHAFPRVTLFVTIADPASGSIVGGLTQDQFTVTEDGKVVEIVEFSAGNLGPISTVLTIDRSGSMEVEGKMAGAKDAATTFVGLMRPQDKAALVVFEDTVTVLQDFTADQGLLNQHIASIWPGGCTAWYDGVWQTVDLMSGVAGRRNAILLSDGIDCREGDILQKLFGGEGSQHTLEEAIEHARQADVAIHTIGLGARATSELSAEGFDEEKLKRMAEATGGTYHHSPTADQLAALYQSFAESTQKEYVITVKSGRASYDGTRRNIRVTVGESHGGSAYVEQHLLNVQSNGLVALAFAVPLALAIVVPLAWRRTRRPAGRSSVPPPPPPEPSSSCPRCRQPVRAGARFCSSCGATLPAAAPAPTASAGRCSRCGLPVRPGAQFCSNCGQRNPV